VCHCCPLPPQSFIAFHHNPSSPPRIVNQFPTQACAVLVKNRALAWCFIFRCMYPYSTTLSFFYTTLRVVCRCTCVIRTVRLSRVLVHLLFIIVVVNVDQCFLLFNVDFDVSVAGVCPQALFPESTEPYTYDINALPCVVYKSRSVLL
jgi:hypothetical protein